MAEDAAHVPPDGAEYFQPSIEASNTGDWKASPAPVAPAMAGTIIAGKYKLLQQIGEGGMGTIWMADQTAPVKRRVAVKLIRVDRVTSQTILGRFEAERQAIAMMDHPHIAKLLDAGTTDSDAPFFVMELVKGIPLTAYCDKHKLNIPQRLLLFTQICSAVQHAHQKGIIHRDLKPSNILVESHDDKPVPKVIDFGLAKATNGVPLTENTLFTGFEAVVGTLLYMAPEQASFNALDVDTRADIYALGVILYELLTGTTPITRETMKTVAREEMMRIIREQEAPTPSTRLSSLDAKPSIAAIRGMESFSGDGRRVVTASFDNTARVWDAETGKELARLKGHTSLVQSASFSRDGHCVVTASNDGTARVWDAETGKELAFLKGHTAGVWSASFSGDGRRVVTASLDNTARVWDAESGKELARLTGHTAGVVSASFSGDGRRAVTASRDNTVRVWDAETGKELALLKGHANGVVSAFSGDGRRVVTASLDNNTVRVWDAETGKEFALLKGHSNGVVSASFSGDGRRVVTASDNNTARVWDAETGKLMLTLPGHTGIVKTASFSPDGAVIRTAGLAGSDDEGKKSIRVRNFDTRPASETFLPREPAPPPRTPAPSPAAKPKPPQ